MTVVIFDQIAAGGSFGPYNAGDVVDLAPSTISKLGTKATHTHPDPTNAKPTKRADSY